MRDAVLEWSALLCWVLLAASALVKVEADGTALTSDRCEGVSVRDAQGVNDALAASLAPSVDVCLDSANSGCVFS